MKNLVHKTYQNSVSENLYNFLCALHTLALCVTHTLFLKLKTESGLLLQPKKSYSHNSQSIKIIKF